MYILGAKEVLFYLKDILLGTGILYKHLKSCMMLIQGENVRMELIETAKALPETFNKIMLVLNGDSVSKVMEYYTNFVKEAHTEKEVKFFWSLIMTMPLKYEWYRIFWHFPANIQHYLHVYPIFLLSYSSNNHTNVIENDLFCI
jgi:UDP-2,3-diacylglucosamine pyrophosphatase LpxH